MQVFEFDIGIIVSHECILAVAQLGFLHLKLMLKWETRTYQRARRMGCTSPPWRLWGPREAAARGATQLLQGGGALLWLGVFCWALKPIRRPQLKWASTSAEAYEWVLGPNRTPQATAVPPWSELCPPGARLGPRWP